MRASIAIPSIAARCWDTDHRAQDESAGRASPVILDEVRPPREIWRRVTPTIPNGTSEISSGPLSDNPNASFNLATAYNTAYGGGGNMEGGFAEWNWYVHVAMCNVQRRSCWLLEKGGVGGGERGARVAGEGQQRLVQGCSKPGLSIVGISSAGKQRELIVRVLRAAKGPLWPLIKPFFLAWRILGVRRAGQNGRVASGENNSAKYNVELTFWH
ncbi:hypothetical protein KM043_005831 [Ampulex compressa]|nr:hypothetical protein KM043_005831 [Ampulex compressa]